MGASVSVAQGAPLDAGTYKADEAAVERFCELLRIPTVSRDQRGVPAGHAYLL